MKTKIRLLRDAKGKAIASFNSALDEPGLVPLDAVVAGGKAEEVEIEHREFFELDKLYHRLSK